MTQRDQTTTVHAWRERITIPTYEAGQPDANPVFLEKRVYQGSSGAVYPYPVVESIANEKADRDYDAVWLENEYLKIMILPELGGRVQMALDKTNNYHFVYYNRVIKPALVGLAGPWISGGIEFNWPQHHRPSTFHPVDVDLIAGDDGSWTVWCNEIDRMVGTRGMHGFRLCPGKAYLEVLVRLSNRTPLPETCLWCANPAGLTDDDGPYVELMCGVYTDNQPDFSWLSPGEEKSFSQFFMPYKGVGVIKNATVDAVVGLEVEGSRATVRVYVTAERRSAKVVLMAGERIVLDERFDASPHTCREFYVSMPADVEPSEMQVAVYDAVGTELV